MSETGGDFDSNTSDTTAKDTVGIGMRFRQRLEKEEDNFDYFGDRTPGYSSFSFPWNVSFSLNYNYSKPTPNPANETLNLTSNFSFDLTRTWHFSGSFQYDLLKKQLLSPSLALTKDLHCWQLDFTWYPIGPSRGYYLRFGIKSSQLRDLKLEKRSSPLY